MGRRQLITLKDSREKTRNDRPFRLDIELQRKEYALAAAASESSAGKSKSAKRSRSTPNISTPNVEFGKYGSSLARSSVEGIHPMTYDLWSASKTAKSWQSSQSGWNAYSQFCDRYYDCPPIVSPTLEVATHFVGYCYKLRGKLGEGCTATTVQNYVSSVRCRFKTLGWCNDVWYDQRLTAIIQGAHHVDQVKGTPENRRRVLTFDIIRIYADSLAREPLSTLEYLNFWTASLYYFWTSLRPSDVLPSSYNRQSVATALRWGDVRVKNQNSYTILVRGPKTSEKGGDDVVTLVRLSQPSGRCYCPVYYTEFLMAQHRTMNRSFLNHEFVFRKLNGKPLLQKELNAQFLKHLGPIFADSFFSCYSVRAGLVNDMAEHADKFTMDELRAMGKWQSEAMLAYLRTTGKRRDTAVAKMQDIFMNEVIFILSLSPFILQCASSIQNQPPPHLPIDICLYFSLHL